MLLGHSATKSAQELVTIFLFTTTITIIILFPKDIVMSTWHVIMYDIIGLCKYNDYHIVICVYMIVVITIIIL